MSYLAKGSFKNSTTGKHCLESCIVSEKISIIPDGNCLFKALSWWMTGNENMHGQIRSKLITFMSLPRYVKNMMKHDQDIDMKISMLRVWGSDVELFCATIWLEVDMYVLLDQTWQKFSFMGFNPKGEETFQARTVFISRIILIIMNL